MNILRTILGITVSRSSLTTMEVNVKIQLSFLCAVNVFFTFSGVFLNTLVIVSLWKSSQLRKKLCYFMLMVLSCFDLLAVLTNHPMLLVYSAVWLDEGYSILPRLYTFLDFTDMFLGFTLIALLVMNLDRYLSTAYPIFHRTSISREKLLILLALFLLFEVTLTVLSINNLVITDQVATIIFAAIISPPLFFTNYKLFLIARRTRKTNAASPNRVKTVVSLKNISSCLLAVACFIVLYIPVTSYIALSMTEKPTSNSVQLSWLWTKTIIATNSTFNCLIFFWKNGILRTEGMKVIKSLIKGH